MTQSHQSIAHSSSLQRLDRVPRLLRLQGAWRMLATQAGWLAVNEGRVWLTRDGGGDDVVLSAGQRLWLGRGAQVVVESWQPAVAARLGWQADLAAMSAAGEAHGASPGQALQPARVRRLAPGAGAGPAAAGWAALARALGLLGAALLAAARSAEARASRAHGCMAAGESMASSGALQ